MMDLEFDESGAARLEGNLSKGSGEGGVGADIRERVTGSNRTKLMDEWYPRGILWVVKVDKILGACVASGKLKLINAVGTCTAHMSNCFSAEPIC